MSSVRVCKVVPYLEGHSFHSDFMDSAPDTGATAVTFNEHLTFPSAESDPPEPPTNTLPPPRLLLKDRLYVGNLHPTVDEYVCQVLRSPST